MNLNSVSFPTGKMKNENGSPLSFFYCYSDKEKMLGLATELKNRKIILKAVTQNTSCSRRFPRIAA